MKVDRTVWETTSIKVGYTEVSSTGSREVKGRQEVMRILLAGRALGEGGSNRDFEFLGLRGDVEIYLERTRRIPVLITGDIRYVGKGKVRLQRVDLD